MAVSLSAPSPVQLLGRRKLAVWLRASLSIAVGTVASVTRGEPGRLLLEAGKLVEQKKVVALLGPTSETLIPVLRNYAEAHNVPIVLTSGDDSLLPFKKNESVFWTFSISPGLGPAIKALFREFARAGLEPVAPLVADNAKGKRASLWLQGYGPEYHLSILPFQ